MIGYVTTFNQKMLEATGFRLLDSFREYNIEGELFVGGENLTTPIEQTYDFIIVSDIMKYPWFQDWCTNNRDIISTLYGGDADYTNSADQRDKFRQYAARWFRKIATLRQSLQYLDNLDYLIMVDCDAYFVNHISRADIDRILKGKAIAHHTGTQRLKIKHGVEAGIVVFDLRQKEATKFLNDVFHCFESGAFRKYDRWDDSFIFSEFLQKKQYNDIDLISNQSAVAGGHVIELGPFASFIKHEKGSHFKKYKVVER